MLLGSSRSWVRSRKSWHAHQLNNLTAVRRTADQLAADCITDGRVALPDEALFVSGHT